MRHRPYAQRIRRTTRRAITTMPLAQYTKTLVGASLVLTMSDLEKLSSQWESLQAFLNRSRPSPEPVATADGTAPAPDKPLPDLMTLVREKQQRELEEIRKKKIKYKQQSERMEKRCQRLDKLYEQVQADPELAAKYAAKRFAQLTRRAERAAEKHKANAEKHKAESKQKDELIKQKRAKTKQMDELIKQKDSLLARAGKLAAKKPLEVAPLLSLIAANKLDEAHALLLKHKH